MLTAYFDESRTDDRQPVTVVAGFVASFDMWEPFNRKWAALLKKNGWNNLHMKTFYNGLSRQERMKHDKSLVKFAELARDYTLVPISSVTDNRIGRGWVARKKKPDIHAASFPIGSPYELCSWRCCELLNDWAIGIKLRKENIPIKVVFDAGNVNRHYLEKGYCDYYSQKSGTYLAKFALFDDAETVLPLQAADLYAWELGRHIVNPLEVRESHLILDTIPHARKWNT